MLGDRGCSGGDADTTSVLVQCPGGGGVVDAGVFEEAFVLGSKGGLDEVVWDLVE